MVGARCGFMPRFGIILPLLEQGRVRWNSVERKADTVYLPLQWAFIEEMRHQFGHDAPLRASRLMRYLRG